MDRERIAEAKAHIHCSVAWQDHTSRVPHHHHYRYQQPPQQRRSSSNNSNNKIIWELRSAAVVDSPIHGVAAAAAFIPVHWPCDPRALNLSPALSGLRRQHHTLALDRPIPIRAGWQRYDHHRPDLLCASSHSHCTATDGRGMVRLRQPRRCRCEVPDCCSSSCCCCWRIYSCYQRQTRRHRPGKTRPDMATL